MLLPLTHAGMVENPAHALVRGILLVVATPLRTAAAAVDRM